MVQFTIDHLDPLGQGVSKRLNVKKQSIITFIPKTLPGEQGIADIIKSSKGVEFAELKTLSSISPQRIEPECPHYARCSGCDYQHVSYQDELSYKKSALLFLLRSFGITEDAIELIPAPQRFAYRNRAQLHYRHKYLGMVDANADQILETPECLLVSPAIKKTMDHLYGDKSWTSAHAGRGHIELYEKNGVVLTEWNQPYASGGFSQVNAAMNAKLRQWLQKRFVVEKFNTILDLFSGAGNLSHAMVNSTSMQRIMVDAYGKNCDVLDNDQFLILDLFADDALGQFVRRTKLKAVDLLLLDPPRRGFTALLAWNNLLKPEYIVYVSCNPATLARDLRLLTEANKKIRINNIVLLDMFPSTRHFETIVVLKT